MTLLALGLALLFPQDLELAGKVRDRQGAAVVGAQVELATLPLFPATTQGTRGNYKLAMAAQRQGMTLPKTVTDRDGEWRMLLAPQQAALAAAEGVEVELVVRAPGSATWRRGLGADWLGANGQVATLEAPGPGLDLQLEGATGAYLGYALVERPFRVPGGRSVWLQDLLEVPGNGRIRFAEPPRVPGEAEAPSATARPEAYRVTLYCADLEPKVAFVGTGATALKLAAAPGGRRKILKERAELVPGAITATWQLAGRTVQFRFEKALVPLLGSEAPTAIDTTLGPVALDAWDSDQPLFLRGPEDAKAADAAGTNPGEGPFGSATLLVKRKDQPVFGAGVWIEDAASKRAGPGATLWALTDPEGRASLQGLPHGTWRVLVRHVTFGQREALVSVPASEPLAVTLAKREAAEARTSAAGLPGSLLLDLGEPVPPSCELGVLGADNRLVRKSFDDVGRFVRLDGLVPGPTTLYVKTGNGPAVLLGGVLAEPVGAPPVLLAQVGKRTLRLHVRDSQGAAIRAAQVSLGEISVPGKPPASLGLWSATAGSEPGSFTVELRALGSPTLRIHGPQDERIDVALPTAEDLLDLRLAPPPPPPEGAASRRAR